MVNVPSPLSVKVTPANISKGCNWEKISKELLSIRLSCKYPTWLLTASPAFGYVMPFAPMRMSWSSASPVVLPSVRCARLSILLRSTEISPSKADISVRSSSTPSPFAPFSIRILTLSANELWMLILPSFNSLSHLAGSWADQAGQ